DVAAGRVSVERGGAGQRPSRGVRVAGARARGYALVLVALLAEADRVALLAQSWIRSLLDGMATEEILAVDEPAIGPIDEFRFDRHHRRPAVAVEAEILVVAG